MGKIIIAFLLIVSLFAVYLFDELQNDEIQKYTTELNEKKEQLIKVDSAVSLKQKIDLINIPFNTKKVAEKKLMEKIDFYKDQHKLQFNSNITQKENYFFIKAHKSITNDYIVVNQFLDQLKQDDFLILKQIRTHKGRIFFEIDLQYPYIQRDKVSDNMDLLFQKSKQLDSKLHNNSRSLDLQDISLKYQKVEQVEEKKKEAIAIEVTDEIVVKEEPLKEYIVQLTLIGEHKKAIINGKIVNIYDYIEKVKILDIQKDRVLLKEGNKKRWLKVLK